MTQMQAKLLNFIRQFQVEKGFTPSFAEIARYLGLSSKSSIHRLIVGLEDRGRIRRLEGRARAIEIISAPAKVAAVDSDHRSTLALKMINDICGREAATRGPMLTIRLIAQKALSRAQGARP